MVVTFDDLLDSLSATPVILRHKPSRVEVMDRHILNYTARMPRSTAFGTTSSKATRHPLCAWSSTPTGKKDLPPRLKALEEDLRARHLGYGLSIGNRSGGASPDLEPARSLAGALDRNERRRQVDFLR